jgi:hypothetical protein
MDESNANPMGAAEASTGVDPVELFAQKLDAEFNPQSEAQAAPQEVDSQKEILDDQSEDGDELDSQEDEEEEQTIKVKINGEWIEVPVSEAAEGYSREVDYRNKTKQLAEMRREMEAAFIQERQSVSEDRRQLQEATQFLLSQIQEVPPPDPRLIDVNPTEYLRHKEAYERNIQLQRTAMNALQRTREAEQMENEQMRQYRLELAERILEENLPEWRDPNQRAAISRKIVDHMSQFGYTAERLKNIEDPGDIFFLKNTYENAEKARLWDELQAKSKQTTKRMQQLPPRAERPSRGTAKASDGRTDAMRALKRSGRAEDAAAIFSKML